MARSARYSLTKPKPDADQQDDADDDRLRAVAQEERQHRRDRQQTEHRVVELTSQHCEGADPVRANGVRAHLDQPRRRFCARQPLGRGVKPSKDVRDRGGANVLPARSILTENRCHGVFTAPLRATVVVRRDHPWHHLLIRYCVAIASEGYGVSGKGHRRIGPKVTLRHPGRMAPAPGTSAPTASVRDVVG